MIMQYKFLSAALAGVSAFAVGLSAPSAHAQVQARAFEIAQQPLGPALRAFALQSGKDIVFDPKLVRGKSAPPLKGQYLNEEALRRLLAGSGLTFEGSATGGFIIRALATPGADARSGEDVADIGGVVVIGRRSVETPRDQIKRFTSGISDSVTVADIENTPDTTLPEALDRVVGVSADKYYGTSDGGYVSIRAFDSRYNSIDIDGNPIWFSSQNNRGAQIGVFPSSMVKETSVYKTVTPDQDGNSVGGHISLRTLRAFDGGGRPYLSLGGRVGRFDQEGAVASGPSMRLYGAGKATFGPDRQYGVVVGFNAQRMRNADKYGGVDAYTQVNGADLVNNSNVYADSAYDKDVKNLVGYAKVELRKNDGLYAFLSGTVIDDKRRQYLQREGTYIYQTNGRTTNFSDGAADFNKAVGQTKEYDYDGNRKAKMLGGGVDYQIGAGGVLTVRGNYTDFRNDLITRYPETFQFSNLSGHYDLNGDLPTIRYDNPAAYADPTNWVNRNTTASYVRDQNLRDKVTALRVDYSQNTFADARGFGFAAGASWTRLDRRYDQNQDNYLLPKGTTLRLSDVIDPGATMAGNAAIKMNWDRFWTYVYANGIKTTDLAPASDYALVEDVAAGHAEAYLSGDRYRVIAGVRYETTHDVDDTGDTVGGVSTPSHRTNRYGNWMPNIQGSYDLTPRLKLKLAFTKTIGRPDFADIAPGRTVGVDANGNPVISGSNAQLGPRLSTNYDASLEYYLKDGYVSLAAFHKDLDHETFNEKTVTLDASGAVILTRTTPLNSGSARVTGVEASFAKRRLEFLPGPLKRLGLTANYTWLDSRWSVVLTDGTVRSINSLRNQPKYMGNVGLSYDLGRLDLHLDYRVRGRAFTTTFGTTPAGDQWIKASDQLDLQANWRVRRDLQLTFEARNLTDSYTTMTTGVTNAIYNSVGGGRSYFAGFKYRY
ncbi:TonB-dependent receptor [Caulobacter vibrioides OR37]|jgi:iron complex outermembrane receptor protein|uniref:TonB-dependent receptor n=2 Tax=Caulobacteraceae TaxID=76892 RepID=R0CVU4_CAUVI|nr:TonB-dependent receptor [Caulobacter vibrioides OR37]